MKLTATQLRRIIKEEVETTRLRVAIKNEVRRLFEAATPEVKPANGKLEVTIGNEKFDFSQDEVRKLSSKAGTVYSDDYDQDSEDGCMMFRDSKSGPIKVTIHKSGNATFTDEIDTAELTAAMKEL